MKLNIMKKIYQYLIIVIGAFTFVQSCQNNEIEQRKINKQEIQEIAKKISINKEFHSYVNKQLEIASKINFEANLKDIQNLKSDEELNNWILENISKTNFHDVNEYLILKQQADENKIVFKNKFKKEVENNIFNEKSLKLFEESLSSTVDLKQERTRIAYRGPGNCGRKATRCIKKARKTSAVGFGVSAFSGLWNLLSEVLVL